MPCHLARHACPPSLTHSRGWAVRQPACQTHRRKRLRRCVCQGQQPSLEKKSRAECIEELVEWSYAQGVDWEAAKLQPVETDVEAGAALLRVPLRCALATHEGDSASNELLGADSLWLVRLAARLLRERAAGAASPWASYVAALPTGSPSPAAAFSPEAVAALEGAVTPRALALAREWPQETYEELEEAGSVEKALGGATLEEFRWALAMVDSRSLLTGATPESGSRAITQLCPVVDLLNYGPDRPSGEEAAALEGDPLGLHALALARGQGAYSNVRWDLERHVGLGRRDPEWHLCVSATRPVPAGEEALLCYRQQLSSADCFLDYGMVLPPGLTQDVLTLFPNLGVALLWILKQCPPPGYPAEPEQQLALGDAAFTRAEALTAELDAKLMFPNDPFTKEHVGRVTVHAPGGILCPHLAALCSSLFRTVAASEQGQAQQAQQAQQAEEPGELRYMKRVVRQRCRDLLRNASPLAGDLQALAGAPQEAGEADHAAILDRLVEACSAHGSTAATPSKEPHDLLALLGWSKEGGANDASASVDCSDSHLRLAVQLRTRWKLAAFQVLLQKE